MLPDQLFNAEVWSGRHPHIQAFDLARHPSRLARHSELALQTRLYPQQLLHFGGTFDIGPGTNGGACVRLTMPLPAAEDTP